jgi:hypothetical protein
LERLLSELPNLGRVRLFSFLNEFETKNKALFDQVFSGARIQQNFLKAGKELKKEAQPNIMNDPRSQGARARNTRARNIISAVEAFEAALRRKTACDPQAPTSCVDMPALVAFRGLLQVAENSPDLRVNEHFVAHMQESALAAFDEAIQTGRIREITPHLKMDCVLSLLRLLNL